MRKVSQESGVRDNLHEWLSYSLPSSRWWTELGFSSWRWSVFHTCLGCTVLPSSRLGILLDLQSTDQKENTGIKLADLWKYTASEKGFCPSLGVLVAMMHILIVLEPLTLVPWILTLCLEMIWHKAKVPLGGELKFRISYHPHTTL